MSFCVKCATPLPDQSRYCPSCGADNSGNTSRSVTAADTPTPDPDLEQRVRTELEGQFAIEREIGRGGMGAVYLATETRLHRRVAIKVLPPSFAFGLLPVERFLREARTAATLDHPHVIPIYRVSDAGNLHWYSMKYLEGESLGELLDREGKLPVARVADIVSQVAEALDYAHRNGVVHRDIKPGNVMIGPNGWVTVTDFGIAKAAGSVSITGSGSMVGTPHYMSPEQCAGTELTPAADQYSLAVLAFQMLSGALPFSGESAVDVIKKHCFDPPPLLSQVFPEASPSLTAVVNRGLAKGRGERFATVLEFADAFGRAARGEAVKLPTPRPSESVPAPRPWRRPVMWVGAAVLVAGGALVVKGLTGRQGVNPPAPPATGDTLVRLATHPDSARPTGIVTAPPTRPPARRDTTRNSAPPVEVGFITVGSRPSQAVMTINGRATPSNPITNYQVPAGTVRLHFDVSDSLGRWSYDTTIAVAPRERRNIGRIQLVRP